MIIITSLLWSLPLVKGLVRAKVTLKSAIHPFQPFVCLWWISSGPFSLIAKNLDKHLFPYLCISCSYAFHITRGLSIVRFWCLFVSIKMPNNVVVPQNSIVLTVLVKEHHNEYGAVGWSSDSAFNCKSMGSGFNFSHQPRYTGAYVVLD